MKRKQDVAANLVTFFLMELKWPLGLKLGNLIKYTLLSYLLKMFFLAFAPGLETNL